jgi:outer membrane protein assembly factor BamE (lipoprotein component of BamABCDE complex)
MNTRHVVVLCAALGVMLAAGCSTPASRIKKNPEVFNRLAPEVQEQVKAGRIDVGFSRDAVLLALGEPNRRYTRKTADSQTEVWSYTTDYSTYDRQRVDVTVRTRDLSGRMRNTTEWVWVDVEQRQEYERLRVEFRDDLVHAVETIER